MCCRCEESKVRAEQTSTLLAQVKNGVQHLAEKLQQIKMVGGVPVHHHLASNHTHSHRVMC